MPSGSDECDPYGTQYRPGLSADCDPHQVEAQLPASRELVSTGKDEGIN